MAGQVGRRTIPAVAAGRADRPWLAAILLLAALVRVAALLVPSQSSDDEIYQYLEHAHRVVFHYGIVPWEDHAGIRNYLLPDLLALPMWLGSLVPTETGYLLATRLFAAALSLAVVVAAYALGGAVSRLHGIVAGLVAAIWPMAVYYAGHPQSEPVALAFLMGAIALTVPHGRPRPLPVMVVAGLLFGASFAVRLQMAPAILCVAAALLVRLDRARIVALAAGVAIAIGLSAVADWQAGLTPLAWVARNFTVNIVQHKAASFGVSPVYYYVAYYFAEWGAASVPMAVLSIVGARRYPSLFLAAAVHFLVHSAIGHKEIRFVLPFEILIVILAAIGSVDLLAACAVRLRYRRLSIAILLATWVSAAAAAGASEVNRYRWVQSGNRIAITEDARHFGKLCGLALYRMAFYYDFGGYVVLHRPVPVYAMAGGGDIPDGQLEPTMRRHTSLFNAMLLYQDQLAALPPGYRVASCRAAKIAHPGTAPIPQDNMMCLAVRAGGCASGPIDPRIIVDTDRVPAPKP